MDEEEERLECPLGAAVDRRAEEEDFEEEHHRGLQGSPCPRDFRIPINQANQLLGWALHPLSQVQTDFAKPLKGLQHHRVSSVTNEYPLPQGETISEIENQTMGNVHSQDLNFLGFDSDFVQTMGSEQSQCEQSVWFNSDFVKGLDVDPKGMFHKDFEILQLENEITFPPLNPSEQMISNLQKFNTNNNHSLPHPNTWNGPVKKVRSHSLATPSTPGNSGTTAASINLPRKKVRGACLELYKRQFTPYTQDPPVNTASPKTTSKHSPASSPRVPKKKFQFSNLTSLSVLNHEAKLSQEQERLCDILIEDGAAKTIFLGTNIF